MTHICQPSLFSWGDTSIAWLASHRVSWLTPIMERITALGEATPIMLTIALAYWFWHKGHTKYLTYATFISILLNQLLKGIVMECRPPSEFWATYVSPVSYSFPSGHAQMTLLWIGLAYYLRSKWYAWIFAAIGVLIALSRPYLGVHYIHDVVVGFLLGLGILIIFLVGEKKDFALMKSYSLWAKTFIILLLLTIFNVIVNRSTGFNIIASAGLFGFWLGCQLETKYLHFKEARYFRALFAQCIIGVTGIFALHNGIKLSYTYLSSDGLLIVKLIQYILLGIWISYLAPLFFKKSLNRGF